MFYIIFATVIIIFDQITKILAEKFLMNCSSFQIIPSVFQFTYHENKGAAWGILSDSRWVFMLISTVAIIALSIYLYCLRNEKSFNDKLLKLSLIMFIGGGIGNMIDRVFRGYVIDFLDFCLIDFPVFNVADSFVTIGAFLMIFYLVKDTAEELKRKKNNE